MATNPLTSEVYLVDLGMVGKFRPFLVVSRFDPKSPRALVTAVPITSQFRGDTSYEVALPRVPWLHVQSYANAQGIMSFQTVELHRKIGRFEKIVMEEVKTAVRYWLDL